MEVEAGDKLRPDGSHDFHRPSGIENRGRDAVILIHGMKEFGWVGGFIIIQAE